MTRLIPYILYLLILAFHRVIAVGPTEIAGAWVDLAGLMVIAVAIYKSEDIAVWFGFWAGIVAFAGNPAELGWHALALAAVAMTAVRLRERLNLASMWSKLYLMFGGVLVHSLLIVLIMRPQRFFTEVWQVAPLVALYTTVVAWLFFLVKEGHLTWRRLKSIF